MAADDADELYGLPLEQFVPERDALAKRLRAEKRRAEADEIKALRKPSVAAWAVNQAVRSQPRAARALWEAGDALIAAQEDLLAGRGDAAALRAAAEAERAALDELAGAARGLLTGHGGDLAEGTIERVRETLHAAAIEPGAREDVAAGRATREQAHSGLGAFGEVAARAPAPSRGKKTAAKPAAEAKTKPAAAPKKAPKRDDDAAARRKAAEEERAQREAEERERRDAARARAEAERELRDAGQARDK